MKPEGDLFARLDWLLVLQLLMNRQWLLQLLEN
jgi:hypothetical protein